MIDSSFKKILLGFIFILGWSVSQGQIAEEVHSDGVKNARVTCSANMDAGSITSITPLQADNVRASSQHDPIFLCFNDIIFIDHASDFDLAGDPNPSTAGGIGYAFYNQGPPTIDGDETQDLINDNIAINPANGAFYIAKGLANGDVYFRNEGQVQNQFNGGNPVQMWFAPITLSDFDGELVDNDCVDVSSQEAFSIVYLNAIDLFSFQNDPDALSGTLSVRGGLPEWDPTRSYTITMVNTSDPSIVGTIDGTPSHNGTVNFQVPEEGNYLITISDGFECQYSVIRRVPTSSDPVNLCLPNLTQDAGSQFCIPITVGNFTDILSFSFSIRWDPKIISFETEANLHPIASMGLFLEKAFTDQGLITSLWFQQNFVLQTLADDVVLFELCFETIGDPGDRTDVIFSSTPTDITITNDTDEIPFETKNGTVTVTPPENTGIFNRQVCLTSNGLIIRFSAFGGVGPYRYELNNTDMGILTLDGPINSPGSTISIGPQGIGLSNYLLTIFDSNGGAASWPIDGSSLSPLNFTLSTADPSCPESMDGAIEIENLMSNGQTSFEWENDETGELRFGLDSIGDLGASTWNATVTDENGCFRTLTDSVVVDTISLNFEVRSQPSCAGSPDGVLRASTDRPGEFEYRWFDSDNTPLPGTQVSSNGSTKMDLEPGKYYVEISDVAGTCPAKRDSAELQPVRKLSLALDPTQITCAGDDDGSIQISVSADLNDSQNYSFTWDDLGGGSSNETNTSTTATNLAPGTYNVTISDNSSVCTIDTFYEIEDVSPLNTVATILQPSCPDGADGRISFGFFNGVGGTEFPSPTWPPYRVFWNGIARDDASSTDENLTAGEYPVTLEDANGCRDTAIFVLSSGPTIAIDTSFANLTCIGDETAVLTVGGDLDGNEILWSTGETGNSISDLGAGTYVVTVTQTMGTEVCPATDTFTISDPSFNFVPTQEMSFDALSGCRDEPNGRIFNLQINIGGPKDWNFRGPDGLDTTFRASLPFLIVDTSGTYYYDVLNSDDCVVFSDSIDAIFPEPIIVDELVLAPSCAGFTDGEITLGLSRPSTGATQFTVDWMTTGMMDPNVQSSTINDLDSGTYVFEVFDVNDPTCSFLDSITIDDPEPLELVVDSTSSRLGLCFGDTDGRIEVTRSGGNMNAAPTWVWLHDGTIPGRVAEDLGANTYRVDVTDDRGCSATTQVEIVQLSEIIPSFLQPEQPICNGVSTSITIDDAMGGSDAGGYSFSIDNGPAQTIGSAVPIFAGVHTIRVTDAAGCEFHDTILVEEPDPIQIGLMDEITVGLGDSARLDANLSGIAIVDSFQWSPPQFLSCADCPNPLVSPADDQLFTLRVVDFNGCDAFGEVMVRLDKARGIFMPNVFTPDGDGINDRWQVFSGPSVRQILSTRILDRWGNTVYFFDEPEPASALGTTGWDGQINGQSADPAVFLYIVEVEFVDGRVFLYRGDINLYK